MNGDSNERKFFNRDIACIRVISVIHWLKTPKFDHSPPHLKELYKVQSRVSHEKSSTAH